MEGNSWVREAREKDCLVGGIYYECWHLEILLGLAVSERLMARGSRAQIGAGPAKSSGSVVETDQTLGRLRLLARCRGIRISMFSQLACG